MKVALVVLDSVGLGYLPDAPAFGDEGADTLDHVVLKTGVPLKNLPKLGLGNVPGVHTLPQESEPLAAYGRMKEQNQGKDTTTGHWEFVGIHLEHPFRTFPEGFPPEVIEAFEKAIGRGVLLNKPYSGTEAIKDFGEEHLRTGKPIVYTSADSVFQIAAHVDVVPLETLYEWCEKAREILKGPYAVARVIARPFAGEPGNFYRLNEYRKDFALEPPENVVDRLKTEGLEFVGIHLEHPFRTFPEGFPPEVIEAFEKAIGRGVLLNKPYSGTEAIKDFGEEHLRTGKPIVYTSADSVFQIAAHVDVVPLETLYEWCKKAREILKGPYAVARVIARPFAGEPGNFYRLNEYRKDFALEPPENVLDRLKAAGLEVVGVGKIPDIYAHRGFTREVHTDDNTDGIKKTLALLEEDLAGLVFTNLVDFDSKYGHRRDPFGYAAALYEFDRALPKFLERLGPEDHLWIVSDHGNDPTYRGTDHTREYGMLLAAGPGLAGRDLGTRETFADLAASLAKVFGVSWEGPGEAFV